MYIQREILKNRFIHKKNEYVCIMMHAINISVINIIFQKKKFFVTPQSYVKKLIKNIFINVIWQQVRFKNQVISRFCMTKAFC